MPVRAQHLKKLMMFYGEIIILQLQSVYSEMDTLPLTTHLIPFSAQKLSTQHKAGQNLKGLEVAARTL
jgi:hypothetical protein